MIPKKPWGNPCLKSAAFAILVLATAPATCAQNACPVNKQVPKNKDKEELNVPQYTSHFYRPLVNGDYFVIEYNAGHDPNDSESGKVTWTDYGHLFEPETSKDDGVTVDQNGSFLPVIYSKEKIAVRVCRLHFTDVLTVTTSQNGLAEQGADIRGATLVTPAASLSTTLDMLQSGTPTGGTTTQPGLGLGAATAMPTLTLSGITQGNIAGETEPAVNSTLDRTKLTYAPVTLATSGRQVALELFAMESNAKELSRLVDRTMGLPYPTERDRLQGKRPAEQIRDEKTAAEQTPIEKKELLKVLMDLAGETKKKQDESQAGQNKADANKARGTSGSGELVAPGSVHGVEGYLASVLTDVESDDTKYDDSATFDSDMTNIQNLNAQISTLSSALTTQAFASNALTLLNNFAVLAGVVDLADIARKHPYCAALGVGIQGEVLTDAELKQITVDNLGGLTLAQVKGIDKDKMKLLAKDVQPKVAAIQAALGLMSGDPPPGDQPLCSMFEAEKVKEFWDNYYQQVNFLLKEVKGNRDSAGPKSAEDAKTVDSDLICDAKGLKGSDDYPNHDYPYTVDFPYDQTANYSQNDRFAAFAGCRLDELSEKINGLRDDLRLIDVGTTALYTRMNDWYSKSSVEQTDLVPMQTTNAYVRLSIVVQRGYTPFTLANAGGTLTAAATTNVPAPPGTASTSTPAHAVKTILIEVHRLANFNLMGGVMLIHVPTRNYALQTEVSTANPNSSGGTTTYMGSCGSGASFPVTGSATPPTYQCVVQTQQSQWQVAGMAGVLWYPAGHDYFPRRNGFTNTGRNLIPSLLLATSVTSLGNAMGGINWEPMNGIDFYAGIASAHQFRLPAGFSLNNEVPSGATLQSVTTEHGGLALGVGFDLGVIGQIFGAKGTAAGMP